MIFSFIHLLSALYRDGRRPKVTYPEMRTLAVEDLTYRRWTSWCPWLGFCERWDVFEDLHYATHWRPVRALYV